MPAACGIPLSVDDSDILAHARCSPCAQWEGDTPDKPETKRLGDEDKAQREGSARKLRETSEEVRSSEQSRRREGLQAGGRDLFK